MAIETYGKHQLHLIAYQLPENGQWAPYLMIHKFDDESANFKCVLEKHRVGDDAVFPTYDEAINEARRVGNALLERLKI